MSICKDIIERRCYNKGGFRRFSVSHTKLYGDNCRLLRPVSKETRWDITRLTHFGLHFHNLQPAEPQNAYQFGKERVLSAGLSFQI